jgi:hypothetical protein
LCEGQRHPEWVEESEHRDALAAIEDRRQMIFDLSLYDPVSMINVSKRLLELLA